MQWKRLPVATVLALTVLACAPAGDDAALPADSLTPPEAEHLPHPDSDVQAIEIARAVMQAMGGQAAWDDTRFVSWNFFARRQHYWDRVTGDIRIEFPTDEGDHYLILMNIHDKSGRAWKNEVLIEDPEELQELLTGGHQMWVNDSYWMFMPYKLLDPGVKLIYGGERAMEDGRLAAVLDLTFDAGVGYTPENRYEVFVARDTGLVEQWAFYATADGAQPNFTLPWAEWKQFGGIRLATKHGRDLNWGIAVHEQLPLSVFEDPAPVQL